MRVQRQPLTFKRPAKDHRVTGESNLHIPPAYYYPSSFSRGAALPIRCRFRLYGSPRLHHFGHSWRGHQQGQHLMPSWRGSLFWQLCFLIDRSSGNSHSLSFSSLSPRPLGCRAAPLPNRYWYTIEYRTSLLDKANSITATNTILPRVVVVRLIDMAYHSSSNLNYRLYSILWSSLLSCIRIHGSQPPPTP